MSRTSPSDAEHRRGRSWPARAGRLGYGAKGVVYLLVGGLALATALGVGGSVGGSKDAIVRIGQQPFGRVALGAVALGLACYTVWRLLQATTGAGTGRRQEEAGAAERIVYVVSGLTHATLALFAASLALGSRTAHASGGGGGGGDTADWTAKLLAQPFGRWLVGAVGVVVVGFGLRQLQRAWQAEFLDRYRRGEMTRDQERGARRIGQLGLASRGVVFAMTGVFVVRAAIRVDPSESKGMGGALATLLAQPYGRWLLGVVAAGLVAYGLFCFSYVRWRDFGERAGGR